MTPSSMVASYHMTSARYTVINLH